MRQPRLGGAVLLAGLFCAIPAFSSTAIDPLENANRQVHAFNREFRSRILDPIVGAYRAVTTPEVRQGIGNAVSNLGEPIVAASALAAGRTEVTLNAAMRFGINLTLGYGGVRDRAAEMGYARRGFGLGDTLCDWGVPSGPFVMLPIFGPSTVRDTGAWLATSAALAQVLGPDAVTAWNAGQSFTLYERLDGELQRAESASLDDYALLRSLHLQRRAASCELDRQRLRQEEDEEEAAIEGDLSSAAR
jgi:phospholipid-binding lipoprotein MlaA